LNLIEPKCMVEIKQFLNAYGALAVKVNQVEDAFENTELVAEAQGVVYEVDEFFAGDGAAAVCV